MLKQVYSLNSFLIPLILTQLSCIGGQKILIYLNFSSFTCKKEDAEFPIIKVANSLVLWCLLSVCVTRQWVMLA